MMRMRLAIVALIGVAVSGCASGRRWDVTVRDPYLQGLGADNVWSAAKSVGITRIEVALNEKLACPHLFEKDGTPYGIDTPEQCNLLHTKLKAEGMSIGCFAMLIKLTGPDDEKQALDRVSKAAVAIRQLNCRILMLPIAITGPKGERVSDEEFIARGKTFIRQLDRIGARTGTQLVIENLGFYWNRPEILEPVLKAGTPDHIGLLHDVCNMYWYGYPLSRLYTLADQFAPYVRCVHAKNVKYPANKREQQRTPGWEYDKYTLPIRGGDIDFARILASYAKAGYVGDVCIEDDSLPDFDAAGKRKALQDDVALLREIIAKLLKKKQL